MNPILIAATLIAAPFDLPDDFILVSHRGIVTDDLVENSLAALEETIRRGYTHIEVDIRSTKDAHPVVLHDANLQRTTGVDANVADLTLAQLHQRVAPDRVPTLETYAKTAHNRIAFMSDMKTTGPKGAEDLFLQRLRATLERYDLLESALFIGHPLVAKHFEGEAKSAMRLPLDRFEQSALIDRAAEKYFAFNHGDDFNAQTVRGFQALGLQVIVSINTGHYKTGDPIEQGLAHVRKMLSHRVDGLQIDSVYEPALPQKSGD